MESDKILYSHESSVTAKVGQHQFELYLGHVHFIFIVSARAKRTSMYETCAISLSKHAQLSKIH